MTRLVILLAMAAIAVCACAGGSSTTARPAIDKPVVGPDGAFWDAIEAARQDKPERMKLLLSTRFVHRAILPNLSHGEPTDEEEYISENARMERELEPFLSIRVRLYARYMSWLRELARGKVVEAEAPTYDIKHKDSYGFPLGPNEALVKVNIYTSQAPEPQVLLVSFIQDGDSWRIDSFSPDPLFGEFVR